MNFKAILHGLVQFWERILALLVFLLIVGLLVWLGIRALHLEKDLQVEETLRPREKKVVPLDITSITNNMALLETPSLWATNDLSTNINQRVFIARYMKLLPGKDEPEFWDDESSNQGVGFGGIPTAWLRKYGFPVTEDISGYDTDGDGFTNWEEYKAGTNPTDPKSHPDFAVKLRLVRILPAVLPFYFDGIQQIKEGKSFVIRKGNQSFILKQGDVIPDQQFPGYKIIQLEEKTTYTEDPSTEVNGKPLKIPHDASELVIQREGKAPIHMKQKKEGKVPIYPQTEDLYAQLYFLFEHNPRKIFQVGEGQTFLLQDIEYQVITIKKSVDNTPDEVVVKCTNPEIECKEITLQPFSLEEANQPPPPRKAAASTEPNYSMPGQPGMPPPYRGPPFPPHP